MRKIFYKVPILNKIVTQRDKLLKKNFKLEEENAILLNKTSEINGFEDIFLSPWTDEWKKFNLERHELIDNLLEKLKISMDKKSKEVIDVLWEKMIYLIPYNKYKKAFLYKNDVFFSKEELNDQKKSIDLTKYTFPKNISIEPQIFSTKNGLIFLPEEILMRIKGNVIIDGGGYIGDSAIVFCEQNPSRIYSFEPVDLLYEKLVETIELNGNIKELVEPIKLGLSDKEEEVKIFGVDSGASLYTSQKDDFQKIRTTTIDKFVSEKKIEKVGLIKLDVEGSESKVIEGSVETIRKHKPILLISIYHRPEDFFFIKPFLDELSLGYKFMVRKTSSTRVTSETVLIGYVK